ncbi:MAG: FeoB-associated Cys-rich membrane protein [Bacteroidota bacterium]|jgi:hypothetical protein
MIQYIIVGVIFIASIFFIIKKFVFKPKKNCGGADCGCK